MKKPCPVPSPLDAVASRFLAMAIASERDELRQALEIGGGRMGRSVLVWLWTTTSGESPGPTSPRWPCGCFRLACC